MCAGISNPWQHLGSADRPIRRLLSCLIPVKVDQTARLFVGQWRAPVRSCPVRRKKAEKLPADLLLGFHRAVKSKTGSILECQNLILRLCLEGKSSSRGGGGKRTIKSLREECLLSHWTQSSTSAHSQPKIRPPAPVLNSELTAGRRGVATQTPGAFLHIHKHKRACSTPVKINEAECFCCRWED